VLEPVPELVSHYAELLHPGYRVLDHDPLARELAVERLLLRGEVWRLLAPVSSSTAPPLERDGAPQVREVLPDAVISPVEILLDFLWEGPGVSGGRGRGRASSLSRGPSCGR
jgi:hypothetical protein